MWQRGLRNPFKMTFRPGTSKLYVNDVGWNTWEEINFGLATANFGWPCFEGNGSGSLPSSCSGPQPNPPLYTYGHTTGGAIVGGAFFEGTNYPAQYVDKYFIADYAQHWIRYVTVTANDQFVSITPFATGDATFLPVELMLAPDGNLNYINISSDYTIPSGTVNRILCVGAGNHAPIPKASATPTSGYATLDVSFDSAGTTDLDNDPLAYHWVFGDGVEADGMTATHTYEANGTYLAALQVNDTHVTREAKVSITVGSLPPSQKSPILSRGARSWTGGRSITRASPTTWTRLSGPMPSAGPSSCTTTPTSITTRIRSVRPAHLSPLGMVRRQTPSRMKSS